MKLLFYTQACRPFNCSITGHKKGSMFSFYRHPGLYRFLGKFSHWWGRPPASSKPTSLTKDGANSSCSGDTSPAARTANVTRGLGGRHPLLTDLLQGL